MRLLAEVGLTTREACGNSVRNVTACPLSGFIADEVFDVQPYARATSAFLIRNPFCQQMARKFKIAFSACPEDCAATAIHDIGMLGRIVEEGGRSRHGFRVVVGGGLGSTPFTAKVLSDFVPLEELLIVVKAILQVFADHGNRRSKMKARLKFVVHKMGIDAFRVLVAERIADRTEAETREADILRHLPVRLAGDVARQIQGRAAREAIDAPSPDLGAATPDRDASFLRWLSASARPHRDPARAVVIVMVPLGDLQASRLAGFAAIVREYGSDHARVAAQQNLVLPDVRRADLRALYRRLVEIGLADAGAGSALDVTACPGSDTCSLGITSSKGVARAVRAELEALAAPGDGGALRGVTIKVSGCPNSCGQHHIANIGLHGVVKKVGGRQIPAYQIHFGGGVGHGEARIGEAIDKVPAKNAPAAVAALLALVQAERKDAEPFAAAAARVPKDLVRAALAPFLSEAPEGVDLGVDWGQTDPFSTEDLGTGECAGAGTDATVDPFDNYVAETTQTALFIERGQWVDAVANLNRSQYTLARILLEPLGKAPDSDYECACEIRSQVIDRGFAGELWNENHAAIDALLRSRLPDPDLVLAVHLKSIALLGEARAVRAALSARKLSDAAEIPG
jgi:sulfite reductase beta subunit-like hemoprotein